MARQAALDECNPKIQSVQDSQTKEDSLVDKINDMALELRKQKDETRTLRGKALTVIRYHEDKGKVTQAGKNFLGCFFVPLKYFV